LSSCVFGSLYSKLPSCFPSHKEFGHETAYGVVPVIGGLVIANDAENKKKQISTIYSLHSSIIY